MGGLDPPGKVRLSRSQLMIGPLITCHAGFMTLLDMVTPRSQPTKSRTKRERTPRRSRPIDAKQDQEVRPLPRLRASAKQHTGIPLGLHMVHLFLIALHGSANHWEIWTRVQVGGLDRTGTLNHQTSSQFQILRSAGVQYAIRSSVHSSAKALPLAQKLPVDLDAADRYQFQVTTRRKRGGSEAENAANRSRAKV